MPPPRSLVGRLLSKLKTQQSTAADKTPTTPPTPSPSPSPTAEATRTLQATLPGLLARASAASKLTATSPAVTALLQAMLAQQTAISEHIKAKDPVAAAKALPALAQAIDAVMAREQLEAQQLAAALQAAKDELQAASTAILPADAVSIRRQLINVAQSKALKGDRQAALALLAQVKPRCDAARASMAQIAGAASVAPWWDRKFAELMAHRHKAAFKADIAPLQAKRARALVHAKEALQGGADGLFADIHWGSVRLLALADQHGAYVTRRDRVTTPQLTQLRTAEPRASAQALSTEIDAVQALLVQAGQQADERLYEAANRTLDAVEAACAKTATLKQLHADFSQRLVQVGQILATVPDTQGTPFDAETTAMRTELARITTLGTRTANLGAAHDQLLQLLEQAQEAARIGQAAQAAQAASAEALGNLAGAALPSPQDLQTSLQKVRQLLAQLQGHPGRAGIAAQIQQISERLDAADAALKA